MHSAFKIHKKYPFLSSKMVEKLYGHEMEGHNRALWAIRSMYTNTNKGKDEKIQEKFEVMFQEADQLDMSEFHSNTTSKYFILQCKLQVRYYSYNMTHILSVI